MKACQNCDHFGGRQRIEAPETSRTKYLIIGECRLYPPQMVEAGAPSRRWPEVWGDSFCGQFKSRIEARQERRATQRSLRTCDRTKD